MMKLVPTESGCYRMVNGEMAAGGVEFRWSALMDQGSELYLILRQSSSESPVDVADRLRGGIGPERGGGGVYDGLKQRKNAELLWPGQNHCPDEPYHLDGKREQAGQRLDDEHQEGQSFALR